MLQYAFIAGVFQSEACVTTPDAAHSNAPCADLDEASADWSDNRGLKPWTKTLEFRNTSTSESISDLTREQGGCEVNDSFRSSCHL